MHRKFATHATWATLEQKRQINLRAMAAQPAIIQLLPWLSAIFVAFLAEEFSSFVWYRPSNTYCTYDAPATTQRSSRKLPSAKHHYCKHQTVSARRKFWVIAASVALKSLVCCFNARNVKHIFTTNVSQEELLRACIVNNVVHQVLNGRKSHRSQQKLSVLRGKTEKSWNLRLWVLRLRNLQVQMWHR